MTPTEFKEKYAKPVYLGDGLFAEFDGYHFILKTDRNDELHWVGLEPNVFDNLLGFREAVYKDAKTVEPG